MNIEKKKSKKLFLEGAISPEFIADSISKHSTKKNIGAHQIFLGQIRSDEIDSRTVQAIEFSTYVEMAEEEYYNIREIIFAKYELICMHVYHSLGRVNAGEINLFVFVSSVHRNDATEACREMVELIKTKLPIWGKEIFDNDEHTWKINR
ncbi:MAG: molybdenum cofactor biosynthesis protein MoaE [Ignavibacteria bacterium]